MTELLSLPGGTLAYDLAGTGPLIVLSHGMGSHRQTYRHLLPLLADAGYRVANMDMRGHGESSMNWPSHTGGDGITQTDVANDILDLIRHLGGPAVVVGNSMSGGSATIAAATAPDLVTAVVEIGPFTQTQGFSLAALFTVPRYRKGMLRLGGTVLFKSLGMWMSYQDVAHPIKPADHAEDMAALRAKLSEPGRFAEFMKTGKSDVSESDPKLAEIKCPALIIMGTQEPDFANPKAEAEGIVAKLQPGIGRITLIEGSGHYPQADSADRVARSILDFLDTHV
ncbi:alpha/beta hydrolase [Nocardia sp. NEAU-G5]|uniref:Alpha/beta hydrolase n=1 Tax=Nocardia albiluteola TaxID=2842303 RepID=A0ABS6AQ00_9NOCA|nr:alpha/beta hydrolase [Nocardia albiluteola]MBU3060077.1 alpha/beta hydrolase [Nocardia albiluteola]